MTQSGDREGGRGGGRVTENNFLSVTLYNFQKSVCVWGGGGVGEGRFPWRFPSND